MFALRFLPIVAALIFLFGISFKVDVKLEYSLWKDSGSVGSDSSAGEPTIIPFPPDVPDSPSLPTLTEPGFLLVGTPPSSVRAGRTYASGLGVCDPMFSGGLVHVQSPRRQVDNTCNRKPGSLVVILAMLVLAMHAGHLFNRRAACVVCKQATRNCWHGRRR
jgi:hypothetical protein